MQFRLSQPEPVSTFEVSGKLNNGNGSNAKCDDLTSVRMLVASWLKLGDADKLPLDVTRKLHLTRSSNSGDPVCEVHWVVSGYLPPHSASSPFANYDAIQELGTHLLRGLSLTEGDVLLVDELGPHRAKLRLEQEV